MRQPQVRAWILLSVPKESKPLSYVLGSADGLNKAIPSLDELRDSLSWLQAAQLISVNNGEFQRTPDGEQLMESCRTAGGNAFDLWDKVESVLTIIVVEPITPFELTAAELKFAHDEYSKRFWETYEKLREKDT